MSEVAPLPATARSARPRLRVLVVDDEPIVVRAVAHVLRDHEVHTAGDAHTALARVHAGESFDVLVCDVMMPEMTGPELHAEVARVQPALAERTIFMTAGAVSAAAQRHLTEVQRAVVAKPFASIDLRTLVLATAGE